jgi:S-adenosylmethionine decarboxylase
MPSTPSAEIGSVDLMGFEGAEKKMEVIFSSIKRDDGMRGLRSYGLEHWSSVVATLNGSILLNNELEDFDSYLISESSLFVYSDRVIILTCGTTTLLKALPSILESARKIDMEVSWFQFSRKNFLYPDEQHFPHKSFDEEVKFCSEMFSDGQPHILGPLNGDHWYVFIADRMEQSDNCESRLNMEQTLNIYMYGINPDVAQLFMKSDQMILPSIFESKSCVAVEKEMSISKEAANSIRPSSFSFVTTSAEATSRSGIDRLMENAEGGVVHDHLFDPCGYSMNGVASKSCYWTIHITPEAHCSYVSFETNISPCSYQDLVARVVCTFQPQRATMVVQADKFSPAASTGLASVSLDGFSITGQSMTQLSDHFTVQLINYEAVDQSLDDGSWTSTSSSQSSLEAFSR